ncbi:D-amino acid dehydrogenase small subunit [Bordetella ansorpii]|uniref:D-amino acid dehydrogenase small subunit n=1 Tax=Bordetella ansorpii TaxID=288768 RepID=A0A157SS26_9BORD|nr:D-amino acid dehydrogenase [Bordetella ansorpii]SAI73195.1 D-amino acid dehydrogenase small subunit [Bordetella ansorpii]
MTEMFQAGGAAPDRDAYWQVRPAGDARGSTRHVTVIGAGIVGLASAAALARAGRPVTVLDAAAAPGLETSQGNGCQLSYGYVAPLAQPGVLAELPRLLFAKGAPLKLVPRWDPAQWRWLMSFLAACRADRAREGSLALLMLGRLSHQETDLWVQGSDARALSFARSGKLVVLPSEAAMAKARRQLELQAPVGPLQQALSADECLRREPALERFRSRMAGAIHTPSECAVDSEALCADLRTRLEQRGVRFEFGTRVQGFRRHRNGRVTHLVTGQGAREVEDVVLATGPHSAAMARMLGFAVPVYPLKGYSITAPILDPHAVPRASVTDAARKVVYARLGQRLRVAGVVEIRGYDRRLDASRIDELVAHTREAFGDAVDLESVTPWMGLRPATPTSVPIIGRSPVDNVFLNIGQGALGLTLAFGSASRLADAMAAA